MALDCDGKEIQIGSKVKLLRIDQGFLDLLRGQERKDVVSMIGDLVDVYDIRGQYVCVEKSWDRGRGKTEHHMISVISSDVQLQEKI